MAPGTSSVEDERTTTRHQKAEEKRPTAKSVARATFNAKSTNATKIRPSDYETATAFTIARKTETAKNGKEGVKTKLATLENTEPMALGQPEIPHIGTKKRVRKQRLVSYSIQESASSQDETTSRRSGRKRAAVNKMGLSW